MTTNAWKPIKTAPKDGTQLLLANAPDEDGVWAVRQGFYEDAPASRRWYDIDGEEIEPDYWMPLPSPPPAV